VNGVRVNTNYFYTDPNYFTDPNYLLTPIISNYYSLDGCESLLISQAIMSWYSVSVSMQRAWQGGGGVAATISGVKGWKCTAKVLWNF
jgi:hypothetical protein